MRKLEQKGVVNPVKVGVICRKSGRLTKKTV